jgi:hypothetical protein
MGTSYFTHELLRNFAWDARGVCLNCINFAFIPFTTVRSESGLISQVFINKIDLIFEQPIEIIDKYARH